jgi:hypothetical protein
MPPQTFQYVTCDIPAGMTIADWKRERARRAGAGRRRSRWSPVRQFRTGLHGA